MENKIESIREAFSIEPIEFFVKTEEYAKKYHNIKRAVKEIKFRINPNGNDVYDIFNFKGQLMGSYIAKAMHVDYFIH